MTTCGECINFKKCNEEWGTLAGYTIEACEDFDKAIRVLAVRQPWASLIVEGLKTIEVRTRNTNIRGPVAIYAGWHIPNEAEQGSFLRMIYNMESDKKLTSAERRHLEDTLYQAPHGQILGTVEITDSPQRPVIGKNLFNGFVNKHLAPENYFVEKKTFFWHLKNPVKFAEPVKLTKWPSGGPWARIPKSILPELE